MDIIIPTHPSASKIRIPLLPPSSSLILLSPPPSERARTTQMVDLETVCCMCGDVGFPDKLFRCSKCIHRFQHSYCSSYYSESVETAELCDWCQSEDRNRDTRYGTSWKKTPPGTTLSEAAAASGSTNRSEYLSVEKVKQQDHREDGGSDRGKTQQGSPSPSPRTTTRRYKLLKDVMC